MLGCLKSSQWKPFNIVFVSVWYVFIIFQIYAYFLAFDVPGLSYNFLHQPSFSHSSSDLSTKWPFHPHHIHAFFVLFGPWHPTPTCPPGMDALLTPLGIPHPMPGLLHYVDMFLTLLKFWYPEWTSFSPVQAPTPHTSLLSSADNFLIPLSISFYMNALPTPCPALQPKSFIHFISLRFQLPVSDHHASPWLAPRPHAGQSPHYVDTCLCRTWVNTYFRVLGLPTTLHEYLSCLVISNSLYVWVLVTQSCPTLCNPWTVPARLLCTWDSPGKNTGVGCHALLQGVFPTQWSNPGLPHWILYHLSHQGSPMACRVF